MMTLTNPEYRQLARESSNQMLRYDAERLQGNFEEAGLAIWQAGQNRMKMADLGRQEGDVSRAAADLLSAAACFLQAGNLKWAERAFRELEQLGPLPAERRDLTDARAERAGQLDELARRQHQVGAELDRHADWLQTAPAQLLELAQARLEEFPGWARLHCLLADLETQRGDVEAVARHAALAVAFDSEQTLLGSKKEDVHHY